MISVKMDRVLNKLTKHYKPFTLLSPQRLHELLNNVRLIEMREGEIFQLCGGSDRDYLFLLEGRVEIIEVGSVRSVAGPEQTQNRPIVLPPAPDTTTLVARDDAVICHADREMLDDLVSWDGYVHLLGESDLKLYRRLERVRNALVFRRLPLEVLEIAFRKMHTLRVKAGEEIIRIGEIGHSYYVISKGTAVVYQVGLYDDELHEVAVLGEGDAFGCEALISGGTRSETVQATEDTELLILEKEDFQELISKSLIKTVSAPIARVMLKSGYRLLDVRYPEEYDERHISNANLIPLYELRGRLNELPRDGKYIVCCHSGNRSAVAALILCQNHFEVFALEGGIREWPFEIESSYQAAVG
jgi:rhodanese-related sulfurtransferase